MQSNRRKIALEYLNRITNEYEKKDYKELKSLNYPIVLSENKDDNLIQIEIDQIELTEEYIHIIVDVDDGSFWGSIIPKSKAIIKYRGGAVNNG